jgi:hypothetical protein
MFNNKYGATAVAARPSQRELDQMHSAVRDLYYELFKQRFGREADLWDSSDSSALDRYLRSSTGWTTDRVLELVRSYFESDEIGPERAHQWLQSLDKYGEGPLGPLGIPKRSIAAIDAELARKHAEITTETARRNAAIAEEDEERRFEDARMKVTKDLLARGYEVFKPIWPSSCHLLAMRKTADVPKGEAIRVVVRTGSNATRTDRRFYQVLVSQDPNAPIVFDPPLEEN